MGSRPLTRDLRELRETRETRTGMGGAVAIAMHQHAWRWVEARPPTGHPYSMLQVSNVPSATAPCARPKPHLPTSNVKPLRSKCAAEPPGMMYLHPPSE